MIEEIYTNKKEFIFSLIALALSGALFLYSLLILFVRFDDLFIFKYLLIVFDIINSLLSFSFGFVAIGNAKDSRLIGRLCIISFALCTCAIIQSLIYFTTFDFILVSYM